MSKRLLWQLLQVQGRKPAWEAGAQQTIKRKPAVKAAPAPTAAVASIWASIDANDADLLDDDELLTDEDLVRPTPPGAETVVETASGTWMRKRMAASEVE